MQCALAQAELLHLQLFCALQVVLVVSIPVCAQALLSVSVFATTDPLFPYLVHSQLQQNCLLVSF